MVTKAQAADMLAVVDIADEALNLVLSAQIMAKVPDSVKVDKRAKRVKRDMPDRGDIVGELDENGHVVRTWYVARKPAVFAILRADGTNRPWTVSLDKLTRIGQNIWIVATPTFTGNLYQIPA